MNGRGWAESPLAVVGMACRLPGAEGLDAYWDLILHGRCALGPLPETRFDAGLYYDPQKGFFGKSYSLLGGVVEERPFERVTYPLPDEIVTGSDPVHLTMLEVAGDALRHAGFEPCDVPLRNTGVYVGNARGSLRSSNIACAVHAREIAQQLSGGETFQRLTTDLQQQLLQDVAGRLRQAYSDPAADHVDLEANRVAALVAETFGLTGPTMAMDAACASSFVALGHAARALHHGRIEMAVVGGASYSGWTSLIMFSQAQALSTTGSFPFDARADGFISSDGYAAVIVKTLERALADGDRIRGVIRGMGLSSDGRGKSLWAPRREGQVLAIRRGMSCGVDVSRIQYVEAHGTSTQLGDATELQALTEALGPSLSRAHPVPVSSVKANIGHTRETAGLAGLVKTLLAMQHGKIPPAAGFETPSPDIPWDSVPFYVPTDAADWDKPNGGPRRAAVDAFGIGGLNVHLLVDDEPESRTGVRIPVPEDLADKTTNACQKADSEAIAVVGRGAIYPGARTLAAFEDLLRNGRDPKVPVPAERWDPDLFKSDSENGNGRSRPLGGFVTNFEYDWRKHRIPPKQVAHADPLQFMVLDTAEQALQDAGWLDGDFDREGTAVVIGAGFGGDFAVELALALRLPEFQIVLRDCLSERGLAEDDIETLCEEFSAAFRERYDALEDETASYSSSTLASRVTKTLDLMGGAFSVDAGGGSSLAALTAGVDLLRSHECNAVLCAGAQRSLGPCVYDSYGLQHLLATETPRPAFDAEANGLIPGEGCGFVLLKRLSDAERDGDKVHGVIRGIGGATCPAHRSEAVRTAADRALTDAAITADAVSVIEATGLSVRDVDADEASGLQAAYTGAARDRPAWVDSVASRIGYAHGASGMASLLKLLEEFGDRQLYPAACPNQPIEVISEANGTLRIVEQSIPLTSENGATRLLGAVNTLTLNGQAHHLLVECPAPQATTDSDTNGTPRRRLFRMGAVDPDDLALKLNGNGSVDAATRFAESGSFSGQDEARLVVVAEDRTALGGKLDLARRSLAHASARPVLEKQGIFVGGRRDRPLRIAFAFAGQGSQYAGMLRELVSESPVAATFLRELDETLGKLGLPTFEELVWEDGGKLGRELFETQLSVLLADVLMFRVLTAQGIRPDVITAHSFGEYPALVASGAWDLEQAIEMTRIRCRAIADCGGDGGLLATTASMEQVEQLLQDETVEDVFVANSNAPEQTVVGGSRDALRRFSELLQSRGYEAKELPVPAPFHTPLLDPVREPLRAALETVTLRAPATPVLSSVTNRYTADPLDLRENLIKELVRPVRYVELVRRLVNDGVDVIIEVGPREVLTKLHRQIIEGNEVGVIASDDPRNAGSEPLLRVQALLECRGYVPVNEQAAVAASSPASGGNGAVQTTPGLVQLAPIVHFDATAKRRERNRRSGQAEENGAAPVKEAPASDSGAKTAPDDELAGVLVRFVCEHTGYPPEVVDLDAELEADLGIDSIKKAQLLGELREHFPLRPAKDVSLDDFPTLRHILEFIRASQDAAEAMMPEPAPVLDLDLSPDRSTVTVLERAAPARIAAVPSQRLDQHTLEHADSAAAALNLKRFSGSPYEMGYQHGQQEGEAIRKVLHKYVDLLGPRLFEMRPLQAALDHRDRFFGEDGLEELRGIADAVGMPVDHVTSFNYGLSMEFLPGCTQFAVTAKRNRDTGLIHAVNEDWMLALALPGTLKRMAQVRFPDGGIPFLTLSTCGELAGQNGINARGLAVSSTLLLDRIKRDEIAQGRVHPALVKCILERAESIDEALEIIRELPRNGAWSMCISQHDVDRLCYVEYDPESVEVRWADDFIESTNHCLLKAALSETPDQSCQRLDRLHELLHGENGTPPQVTVDHAQAILRDRYDRSLGRVTRHPTKGTIRRPYTQASLVMRPASGEVWITADSVPDQDPDRFHRLDLNDLFHDKAGDNGSSVKQSSSPSVSEGEPARCRAIPDRIMNRFVLRIVDAPLPEERERSQPLTGRVLLLGENPTAEAVRRQLDESGAEVLILPVVDGDATLQHLDEIWAEGPAPTLLLLTGRDEHAGVGVDETAWSQRRENGVLLPYLVCQKWVQLIGRGNLASPPRLIAATGLGGDLGLSGRSAAIEGGALSGLLKAIRHEFDQITTKVIDAPLEDPPQLVARCLLEELESAAADVEVAYVCGRRRVLQPVPRMSESRFHSTPHGTWVVTGGGRGVTAIVARELGRRYGLKLHLIGSSPAPEIPDEWRDLSTEGRRELRGRITRQAHEEGRDPAAAWRDVERGLELDASLRAFDEAGVSAVYHTCDVADREQLAGVLDGIRTADGPIHGVIHGAGFEAACHFDKKTREAVNRTLSIKVDGAINLAALTRDDPTEFFVGFGSISGRFGGHGQTDYSMSSDLLAKLMCRLREERPSCRAVAMHWPVWGEVGMAMRPESKLTLEIAGHQFMPPLEGVAHLIDELEAGAPEGEVLLFDWPATRGTRRSPWTSDEAQAYWRRGAAVADAPLVRDILHVENGRRVVSELAFDPQHDPFLTHHRFVEVPILPLVIALESFAETSCLLCPDSTVNVLHDVWIHDGMRFPAGASERARVDARMRDDGRIACELRSDFRNRRGVVADPSRLHVSAVVESGTADPTATVEWSQRPGKWSDVLYDPDDARSVQRMIWHGPPLQCLKQICVFQDQLWGRVVAPSPTELCPSPQATAWKLPSAVLDACLLACSVLTYVQKGPFHLPQAVTKLQFGPAPATGEECLVMVRYRKECEDRATFDFTLYGADRCVILDARGYNAAFISTQQGAS